MATITSANAKVTTTVRGPAGIVVGPFTWEGFASDDAFATEMADSAEALMGVDGKMSAGYTPFIVRQTVIFQADSNTIALFEAWLTAQQVLKDVLFADQVVALPGLQKAYACVKGALTRITPIPQAKRVLQPVTYEIAWEVVQPSPISV